MLFFMIAQKSRAKINKILLRLGESTAAAEEIGRDRSMPEQLAALKDELENFQKVTEPPSFLPWIPFSIILYPLATIASSKARGAT